MVLLSEGSRDQAADAHWQFAVRRRRAQSRLLASKTLSLTKRYANVMGLHLIAAHG